jgi:hypothetical protein
MARRSLYKIAWLALLLSHLSTAQTPSNVSRVGDELTAAQAQQDFDVVRHSLEEAHGALYRFSTKPELDRRFDSYRARLSQPIGKRAFGSLVAELVASIGDGHARIDFDSATTAALAAARVFPLRVVVEGPRIVVTSNDTPGDSTIRPGMELLSVNGHSANDLLALLLPRMPRDGFIETGRRTRLGRSFAASYWLFVDQSPEFTVTARDVAGATVTATFAGVLNADRDRTSNQNPVNAPMQRNVAALDGAKDNISLRFVRDADIAVLRIRGFGGQTYPAALDRVFRTVRDKGARALILDLRGNGGGDDMYGAQLVSEFTDKPFRYFDHIHVTTIRPSFATWKPSTFADLVKGVVDDPAGGYLVTPALHPGVSEQRPAAVPFLGKAFVLLDGGTFSTAADVTAVLRSLKRVTFVGEESAGAYEGNTSGLNAAVVLPNSGIRLWVQMYGYVNAVSPTEKGRGTTPDVLVERHVADVLRGVDAALERTIELARAAIGERPR